MPGLRALGLALLVLWLLPLPVAASARPPSGVAGAVVIAVEPEARARQAEAEAALAITQQRVAELFGWQPSYPLTLYLVGTDQGMVNALQRYSGFSAASAEGYRSFYGAFTWRNVGGEPRPNLYMNVSRLQQQGQLQHAIAHEYLHVLQWDWAGRSASRALPPTWFLEGMADLFASRIAGTTVSANQQQAELAAARGEFTSLTQLDTLEQWKRHTRTLNDQMSTYGHAYTAVQLLEQRQPRIASVLLKTNEPQGFETALEKLTGLTLPQLNTLLQDRLLGRPASPSSVPAELGGAGRFFTQTSGQPSLGFAVSDKSGAPFWTTFQRLGGVNELGYPVSRRFEWRGFVTQVFQRGALQWRADEHRVELIDLLDELHEAGLDGWLSSAFSTPAHLNAPPIAAHEPRAILERWNLLDSEPAIARRYFEVPEPLTRYGLPTSRSQDMGNHVALRTQRAVFQRWKEDVPWARAGEITLANVGDIAKQAGLFPSAALQPEPWP